MSETTFASGFVYDKDRIKQAKMVELWATAAARKTRRQNLWLKISLTVCVVFLGGAIGALDYAVPMIRLLPIFITQQPTGLLTAAVTVDSLENEMSDATIKSALWQYVAWRESYSWTEHSDAYYRVSVMSSSPVKKAYEDWYNSKEGPMAVYTDKAMIRARMTDMPANDYTRPIGSTPGHFTVYFQRQVQYIANLSAFPVETWKVELQFAMNYPYGFKIEDILTFNPLRIVVTAYPGSMPVASPMAMGGPRR